MAVCRLSHDLPYCDLNKEWNQYEKLDITKTGLKFSIWLCNFNRIFRKNLENDHLVSALKSVGSIKDVLHAAAGLYAASLQSMEKETIYDVLGHRYSFTIVLFSQPQDASPYVVNEIKKQVQQAGESTEVEPFDELCKSLRDTVQDARYQSSASDTSDDSSEDNEFRLVYPSEFSSSSDEESEGLSKRSSKATEHNNNTCASSEDDEDEPDLLRGYRAFIGGCIRRRLKAIEVLRSAKEGREAETLLPHLSVENVIAGACTFRVRYLQGEKRIIHINFLAVRKSLRGQKIGTHMLSLLKNPLVVGPYDALVVHADMRAQEFFSSQEFTDDLLINRQWCEFEGEYINCRLMTYLSGYAKSRFYPSNSPDDFPAYSTLGRIDREMNEWRKHAEDLHMIQYIFFRRMRAEILSMQRSSEKQVSLISELARELRDVYRIVLHPRRVKKMGSSRHIRKRRINRRLTALDHLIARLTLVQTGDIPAERIVDLNDHFGQDSCEEEDFDAEGDSEDDASEEGKTDTDEAEELPEVDVPSAGDAVKKELEGNCPAQTSDPQTAE
ncbi:unnamed protein product [Calicophoron daubneyi]|uniref:N-acetyltransferase domain-containing protein n=1 Tax=Calicophoron daubneyi TaxID=300641 RepID=A0AAV2TFZ0_CALDB